MFQGVFTQVSRTLKELFSCNRTIKWHKTMSEDAAPAAKRARTEEEGSSNEEHGEGEGRRGGQPEAATAVQVYTFGSHCLWSLHKCAYCNLHFATHHRMCSACWSRDFSPTFLSAAADDKGEATKVHSTALLQWKGLPWNAIVIHLFCAVITSSYTCVAIVMHPPTCA